jgi:uncharacterized protein YbjT (DUF2867 family)
MAMTTHGDGNARRRRRVATATRGDGDADACRETAPTRDAGQDRRKETGMILVTGATGTLGRVLLPTLAGRGAEVTGLSRRPRPDQSRPDQSETEVKGVRWAVGDLVTGAGLTEALRDAGTVIHAASDAKPRSSRDPEGTRHLVEAMSPGTHLLYVSIVGVDGHPFGYYRAKAECERIIEESGLPYTILRTTQWHQFVAAGLAMLTRSPIVPLPSGTAVQPLDVSEVADRIAELALGAPAGRVEDMGGPQVRDIADLARQYTQAAGRRRVFVPLPIPGATGRALKEGRHLAPEHRQGKITFEEFLTTRS